MYDDSLGVVSVRQRSQEGCRAEEEEVVGVTSCQTREFNIIT